MSNITQGKERVTKTFNLSLKKNEALQWKKRNDGNKEHLY